MTSHRWCCTSWRRYAAKVATVNTDPLLRRPTRSHRSAGTASKASASAVPATTSLGDLGGITLPVAPRQRGLVLVPVVEARPVGGRVVGHHQVEPRAEQQEDVDHVGGVLRRRPHLRRRAPGGVGTREHGLPAGQRGADPRAGRALVVRRGEAAVRATLGEDDVQSLVSGRGAGWVDGVSVRRPWRVMRPGRGRPG